MDLNGGKRVKRTHLELLDRDGYIHGGSAVREVLVELDYVDTCTNVPVFSPRGSS